MLITGVNATKALIKSKPLVDLSIIKRNDYEKDFTYPPWMLFIHKL